MMYPHGMKYHKYMIPDPSTAKYAPIIMEKILETIEEIINKEIKSLYHIRQESVLAIDLKHAVKRRLYCNLDKQIAEINRFERENASDLRNYPWSESSYEED